MSGFESKQEHSRYCEFRENRIICDDCYDRKIKSPGARKERHYRLTVGPNANPLKSTRMAQKAVDVFPSRLNNNFLPNLISLDSSTELCRLVLFLVISSSTSKIQQLKLPRQKGYGIKKNNVTKKN